MLLHEDSLFLSLSLSELTFDGASISQQFFVKAGGIDLSFLIIMLSMFLMIEKKRRSIHKKRSERYCYMPFCIPCHAFKTKKAKTKIVSSYLLFVSYCRYLISYAT